MACKTAELLSRVAALPAAFIMMALAVCGSARGASPPAESEWGFESDTGGWTAVGCSATRTDARAAEGRWALAVRREFPGVATIMRSVALDATRTPLFRCQVFVPESAGPSLNVLLFVKNKDGLWYQSLRNLALYPGRWSTVEFDVSASSSEMEPLGHFRRWSSGVAAEMEVIGLKFLSAREFTEAVLVDAIQLTAAARTRAPLAITDFRPSSFSVPRFGKFEISFDLSRSFSNPFDPEYVTVDAEFTGPTGRKVSMPGFYYQDYVRVDRVVKGDRCRLLEDFIPVGTGCWKVRFTPDTAGEHSYVLKVVDRTGVRPETLVTAPRRFTCVPSANKGFVRVARDGRNFEFSTGEGFYPIGHNVYSSNDVSERSCDMLGIRPRDDRGTKAYEDIFRKMGANGENFAEVWMASWSFEIEWTGRWKNYFGLGRYNLQNGWKFDRLLSIAEQNGIYLNLVLENHGKAGTFVDPEWKDNPYNEDNGGFLSDCLEFFSRLDAREQYKKKLRYIVGRWGYSTRIMGFALWSELDLTGNAWNDSSRPDVLRPRVEWHREIAHHLKAIDAARHLVTTHYSGTYNRVQPQVVGLADIDYVSVVAYRGQGTIEPLLKTTYDALEDLGKPIIITEFGGTHLGTTLPRLEADLHAGIWSAYMMNYAATPLLWWFMYVDLHDKYGHYKALANYARGEDRRNRGLVSARASVSGPAETAQWVEARALKNDRSAYVWLWDTRSALQRPEPSDEVTLSDLSVSVTGLRPGAYAIEVWDTFKGAVMEKSTKVIEGNVLLVPLPAFRSDVALKVRRSGAPEDGSRAIE